MGIETEYSAHPTPSLNRDLIEYAIGSQDPTYTSQFSEAGWRIYVDIGSHLEVATPESLSVRGLLASHFAAERIAARALRNAYPGSELYKRTIDAQGHTAADHENYHMRNRWGDSTEQAIRATAEQLGSHLASRAIITGPGMLYEHQHHQGSFSFSIDQRHRDTRRYGLLADAAATQGGDKPLVITRHEPFDLRGHTLRLQVVSGSQNMFAYPIASRALGTSAVLRLIEHGDSLSNMQYEQPYEAFHATGGTHGLTARQRVAGGGSYTAAEMQLRIMDKIIAFNDHHPLPEDEMMIVKNNYVIAEAIARGDYQQWAPYVEWIAKKQLLDRDAAHRGVDAYDMRSAELDIKWHSLAENGIAQRLRSAGRVALMPTEMSMQAAAQFPLDPTRAQARGSLMRAAREKGEPVNVSWGVVGSRSGGGRSHLLNDVYRARP